MRTLSLLALLGLSTPAWAVPTTLTHQGRIAGPDGAPLEGVHALTFRVYGEATGGSPAWADTYAPRFEGGVYAVLLGEDGTNPLDAGLLAAYPLWMELEVDGVVLTPRQPLTSAPYASVAGVAESLAGGAVDATGVSVGGVEVIDADGRWVGESPATDWDRVDGVPAELLDGDDDTLAGVSCDEGAVLAYVAGTWTCGTDAVGLDAAAVDARIDARGYATDADLDALALTCDALTGDVDTLDGRVTVLEDGSLVLAADLATLAGRADAAEAASGALAARVGTLEGAVDADTLADLSCLDGELPAWDATAAAWSCAPDRVLTEAEVDAYVADNGYASAASVTTLAGRVGTLETGTTDLDGRVGTLETGWTTLNGRVGTLESGATDLDGRVGDLEGTVAADGLTLAGVISDLADVTSDLAGVSARVTVLEGAVATLVASAFSGSFLDLTDVPADLADGDDDTLAALGCADGEVAQWDATAGGWGCGVSGLGAAAAPVLVGADSSATFEHSTGLSPNHVSAWVQAAAGEWLPLPASNRFSINCPSCGTGSNGSYSHGGTASRTLTGTYNYTNAEIPSWQTVSCSGSEPLVLLATDSITVAGVVNARGASSTGYSGATGTCGGVSGASGSTGASAVAAPTNSPPYSLWYALGNTNTTYFVGGDGGGSSALGTYSGPCGYNGGGGAGGGAVMLVGERVTVSGTIDTSGGSGGPGTSCASGRSGDSGTAGSIWIRGSSVVISGTLTARVVRIDAHEVVYPSGRWVSGSTVGLPGLVEYYQDASGTTHVVNKSQSSVTVTVPN